MNLDLFDVVDTHPFAIMFKIVPSKANQQLKSTNVEKFKPIKSRCIVRWSNILEKAFSWEPAKAFFDANDNKPFEGFTSEMPSDLLDSNKN